MISNLHIPPSIAEAEGVSETHLRGLGKIVVLAGPNGAGKSRLLRAVVKSIHASEHQAAMKRWEREAHGHIDVPATNTVVQLWQYPNGGKPQPSENAQQLGLDGPFAATDAYFASVAQRMWHARDPRHQDNDEVQQKGRDAEAFVETLTRLSGKSCNPHWYTQGQRALPYFGERMLRTDEISSGERLLIAWAIVLHEQKARLKDLVLLIDEPENHLHPAACVDVLERLSEAVGENGQIWIATHSVPLVAWAGMHSVYLVENGAMRFARDRLQDVMASLLGGHEGRNRLQEMLADGDAIAASRFLAECLHVSPQPVQTDVGDRQKPPFQDALHQALQRVHEEKRKLVLLDYGAGRGRLADAICDVDALREGVEYFAFDLPDARQDHREACLRAMTGLGSSVAVDRYWSSFANLKASVTQKFDVVVMGNVLHEIPHSSWLEVLHNIASVLDKGGVLVVLEDLLLSVGELPHPGGYIVLDEHALRALLGPTAVSGVRQDPQKRLMTAIVGAHALGNLSSGAVRKTLEHVQERALEHIIEHRRKKPGGPSAARAYAHYAMQHVNATLAIKSA